MAGGALLPPFSIGYCKGWKRSIILLLCLQAVRELNLQDQVPHRIKATSNNLFDAQTITHVRTLGWDILSSSRWVQVSFGTIHASFSTFKDIRAQVYANRGLLRFVNWSYDFLDSS